MPLYVLLQVGEMVCRDGFEMYIHIKGVNKWRPCPQLPLSPFFLFPRNLVEVTQGLTASGS